MYCTCTTVHVHKVTRTRLLHVLGALYLATKLIVLMLLVNKHELKIVLYDNLSSFKHYVTTCKLTDGESVI